MEVTAEADAVRQRVHRRRAEVAEVTVIVRAEVAAATVAAAVADTPAAEGIPAVEDTPAAEGTAATVDFKFLPLGPVD
jgi:hypothetical protein